MGAASRQDGIVSGRLTAKAYAEHFTDLHPPLARHEALVEADRCYFCHDAPCITACPTGIDIPMFIRQIASDNTAGAAQTIFDQNILGGMCARVCPTETLCEDACVRNLAEDKPVEIGRLQRYATDHRMAIAGHPYKRADPTGKTIAVVGAGPAGLACAHRLAMLGHEVVIFDDGAKPGGLNEYGIAAYKAVDDFAAQEVAFILEIGGITIETGKRVGQDLPLRDLKQSYDAIFLGIGLQSVNSLGIDGEDFQGVGDAIDYIASLRQSDDLGRLPVGRKVVVIGGGMTAIDMATQIKLLGADEVTIVYRRGRARMNASVYEQDLACKKGVIIRDNARPLRLVSEDKRIAGVVFEYTEDRQGRLAATGETFTLAADMVFKAIGQQFDGENLDTSAGEIDLDKGRIKVDDHGMTSIDGIYAGGDCAAGGEDLTVVAVEDGKRAATAIHHRLCV